MKCEVCGTHYLFKEDMLINGLCVNCFNKSVDDLHERKVIDIINKFTKGD